jgi:hypothetical protein
MKRKTTNKNTVHYVLPLGNGWAVKSNGANGFALITDRKQEAITVAKSLAKKYGAQLVVQSKEGKTISSIKYGLPQ